VAAAAPAAAPAASPEKRRVEFGAEQSPARRGRPEAGSTPRAPTVCEVGCQRTPPPREPTDSDELTVGWTRECPSPVSWEGSDWWLVLRGGRKQLREEAANYKLREPRR